MSQWSRSANDKKHPDERWCARCPRGDAPLLLRYDHHVVWIDGRPALLRTYHWAAHSPDSWADALPFEVSLTYAAGHPPAPPAVQQIVDRLSFSPVATIPLD